MIIEKNRYPITLKIEVGHFFDKRDENGDYVKANKEDVFIQLREPNKAEYKELKSQWIDFGFKQEIELEELSLEAEESKKKENAKKVKYINTKTGIKIIETVDSILTDLIVSHSFEESDGKLYSNEQVKEILDESQNEDLKNYILNEYNEKVLFTTMPSEKKGQKTMEKKIN